MVTVLRAPVSPWWDGGLQQVSHVSLTDRGRGVEVWEVANVIVFLASEYSTYLTGEVVSVSSQHP